MRINFEFVDLEAFLAVAEAGSFLRASERLNMSQPALTRRIQKLERSLGVVLIDRTTRSLKLTLAGKTLEVRAQGIVEDAVEAALALNDENSQLEFRRNAIVTIATVPSLTRRILPTAIKAFRAGGRTARVRILGRLANDVAEAVAQGDADIGVCSIPAREPNLAFEALTDDRFVLAMTRDDPKTEQPDFRWRELDGADLIVPMKGTGNRLLIDEALARSRQTLNWTYEVRRTTTALELVEAGIGIAVVPKLSMSEATETMITSRPLKAPSVARSIGIVSRHGHAIPPAVDEFRKILADEIRKTSRADPGQASKRHR